MISIDTAEVKEGKAVSYTESTHKGFEVLTKKFSLINICFTSLL